MSTQNEQRQFIRMNLESEMQYRFSDSARFFSGCCKNLSPTGLMFNCHYQLKIGDVLEVQLISEDGLTPTMKTLVKVVLVKPNDTISFDIGTEILGSRLF